MTEQAVFRTGKLRVLALSILSIVIAFGMYHLISLDAADLPTSRFGVSYGPKFGLGFAKLVCAAIGLIWVYGAILNLWKVVDSTPDVVATAETISFHPSVKISPIKYAEIEKWTLESKRVPSWTLPHSILTIELNSPYWSLHGIFPRKTLKLEENEEDLRELIEFFSNHSVMQERYVET